MPLGNDQILRNRCLTEFTYYLNDAICTKSEVDPLEWWRVNRGKYPVIEQLARKWLSCIATSVPFEEAFSISGLAVSQRRCSLSTNNASDITFLSKNFYNLSDGV